MTIAHAGDQLAARVHTLLQRRSGAAVHRLVAVEELTLAREWHHVLREAGTTSRVQLASGLTLDEDQPFLIFNRIRQVSLPHFAAADEYDRAYAWSEMHALLLSWLHSLGSRVINPPSPLGLAGREYSRIEALAAAARAGLEVAHYGFSTDPRCHPCTGAYQLRQSTFSMISSDCALGDEVPVTVAGRYRTRPDLALDGMALTRLQSEGSHPLMELRLAADSAGVWKLCHLSAFPEHADWAAAGVVADYLGELANDTADELAKIGAAS